MIGTIVFEGNREPFFLTEDVVRLWENNNTNYLHIKADEREKRILKNIFDDNVDRIIKAQLFVKTFSEKVTIKHWNILVANYKGLSDVPLLIGDEVAIIDSEIYVAVREKDMNALEFTKEFLPLVDTKDNSNNFFANMIDKCLDDIFK
jgi:hypothetical protein